MTFSLGGEFNPTRSAMLTPPLGGATAVCALGRESFAYSRQFSSVNVSVAGLAQSNAVGDIVTQFPVILPRLNMVRLNLACGTALLAGVVVSLVYGITPLAILVGIALLVGVLLTLGCVAAILTAVFGFELSVGWMKRFAAPLADKIRFRPIFTSDLIRALPRACLGFFAVSYCGIELLAADNARRFVTGVTVPFARVIGFVFRAADGALNAPDYLRRYARYFGMLTAELSFTLDFLGASWVWAKFACSHTPIIPGCAIYRKLQRWADHTGKTPARIE